MDEELKELLENINTGIDVLVTAQKIVLIVTALFLIGYTIIHFFGL